MDEKRYELVEIQVDAELLEQLEAVKPTWPVPLVWKPVSITIR